jgi:hypothetical protein
MANTNILIKRSGVGGVGRPGSLLAGELAYSYASNTIFIGSPTGNGVVNVGGQFYTSQIDNATAAATGLTLVRRDATGNASFNFITANIIGEIIGNANSATQLQTARNFSISGSDITATAIPFNGTADVTLNAALNAVPSLGAGTYGSTTAIPVIQVAANGRVMNVTTAAISTSFTVAGDTGPSQTISGGDTLTLTGGAGITSTASATDIVTFDVDNTVVRANSFTGGTQTINTNLTIGSNNSLTVTGNLIVFGNTSVLNMEQFEVQDPLILLGVGNYFTDTKDIGFAAHYNDGQNAHTGLIRDSVTKEYHFFQGYTGELDANNNINLSDPSYRAANVQAAFFKGNVIANTVVSNTLTLTNALTVPNGGTGRTSFTSGQIIIGSGVDGLAQIANSTVAVGQTFGSASSVPAFQTDVYGRVTSVSNTAIAIDAAAITSGTLPIARGGTNGTSFTNNQITFFDGTKIASLANSTYTQTGTLAANNTITSITVDGFGRFTAATVGAISGLTVGQGGTGLSTITQNGITYGNGTGNLGVTAAAGVADQTWSNQILTVTDAGVPVWTTSLDGGQF